MGGLVEGDLQKLDGIDAETEQPAENRRVMTDCRIRKEKELRR